MEAFLLIDYAISFDENSPFLPNIFGFLI